MHLFSSSVALRKLGWGQWNLSDTSVSSNRTYISVKRTLIELVPAFLYSLYFTLYKTDISLRRTLEVSKRVNCITNQQFMNHEIAKTDCNWGQQLNDEVQSAASKTDTYRTNTKWISVRHIQSQIKGVKKGRELWLRVQFTDTRWRPKSRLFKDCLSRMTSWANFSWGSWEAKIDLWGQAEHLD